MDIVTRLKKYIAHSGIPVTQFADNCGIPRPTLSQLLNGRNKKVSDEVINKIHEAFADLSIMWLLFGEGSMLVSSGMTTSRPANHTLEQYPTNTQRKPQPIQTSNKATPIPRTDEAEPWPELDFDAPRSTPSTLTSGPTFTQQNDMVKSSEKMRPGESINFTSAQPEPSESKPKEMRAHTTPTERLTMPSERTGAPTDSDMPRIVNIIVYYDDNTFQTFIPRK